MTEALIAVSAAATFLAILAAVVPRQSDVSRRVAALDTSVALRDARGSEFVHKLISESSRSNMRRRFAEAGWYRTTVTQYYAGSAACITICSGLGIFLLFRLGKVSTLTIACAAIVGLCGAMLPNVKLTRAIAARKMAIARSIPDWLDMISTTVEAGIALNAALGMSLEAIRGPLAEELREVLADVRLGRSRAEALASMAGRVRQIDLTATVTSIIQTEKLGGNIGHVLDELAAEARHRRLMRAEELAAQLPVKMVIPMGLLMLPALFVMIFGPVVAEMMARK